MRGIGGRASVVGDVRALDWVDAPNGAMLLVCVDNVWRFAMRATVRHTAGTTHHALVVFLRSDSNEKTPPTPILYLRGEDKIFPDQSLDVGDDVALYLSVWPADMAPYRPQFPVNPGDVVVVGSSRFLVVKRQDAAAPVFCNISDDANFGTVTASAPLQEGVRITRAEIAARTMPSMRTGHA